MRDFQETVGSYHESVWTYDSLDKPGCGTYPYTDYRALGAFPILSKGRADLRIGPYPYPTEYYGFRLQASPSWGTSFWYGGRKYAWNDCGSHTQIADGKQLPTYTWSGVTDGLANFIEGGNMGYKPNVSTETVSRARLNAINNLKSTKVNLGQSLGEAGLALPTLIRKLNALGKTLFALKKGNLSKARRELRKVYRPSGQVSKDAASAVLFWKFGVAPLLNDIEHTMSEIGKAMARPDLLTIKGVATKTVKNLGVPGRYHSSTGSYLEVCEVGYLVQLNEHAALSFLGLSNPIGTLWELVPLSFVINWFISIGDVLNSLDANLGATAAYGYETTVVKGSKTSVFNTNVSPGTVGSKWFAMERKILTSIVSPRIYVKSGIGTGQLVTLGLLARVLT